MPKERVNVLMTRRSSLGLISSKAGRWPGSSPAAASSPSIVDGTTGCIDGGAGQSTARGVRALPDAQLASAPLATVRASMHWRCRRERLAIAKNEMAAMKSQAEFARGGAEEKRTTHTYR